MIDEGSKILFVNGAAEGIFGHAREEMLGRELTMLMPGRLRDDHRKSLRRYLDTGRRRLDWEAIQLTGKHESGKEIPLEVSFGEFVKDGQRFFTGFIRDISERKRAEEELKESEERFRATFEQAAVGMAHVALDGRWLRVNEKLLEIVGYGREELLGLTFQDITHPDDLDAVLGYVRPLLAGEIETYSMEKRYLRKDGSMVWIELTGSLVRKASRDPEYFIAVIEDITERRLAEQRVREAREAERGRIAQDIHDDALQSLIYALQEIRRGAALRNFRATPGVHAGPVFHDFVAGPGEVDPQDVAQQVRGEPGSGRRVPARAFPMGRRRIGPRSPGSPQQRPVALVTPQSFGEVVARRRGCARGDGRRRQRLRSQHFGGRRGDVFDAPARAPSRRRVGHREQTRLRDAGALRGTHRPAAGAEKSRRRLVYPYKPECMGKIGTFA